MNSALEELAAKVSPAVVQIQTTGYGPLNDGDSDRGKTALIVRQHAVGSGVIVDSNGYIMTNAHVVEGAQRIRVALPMSSGDSATAATNIPAGRRQLFDAKVLGVHKESDLALLKIEQTNLPTLSLEAPQNIRVGQMVLAVGSPEGLQSSVTMGVISAVARQADPTKSLNYVQTDAPINPGQQRRAAGGYERLRGGHQHFHSEPEWRQRRVWALPFRRGWSISSITACASMDMCTTSRSAPGRRRLRRLWRRVWDCRSRGASSWTTLRRTAPPTPPACRCRTLFLPPTTGRLKPWRR